MEARRHPRALEGVEPIYEGAEAYLYPVTWAGRRALAKWRPPKEYRHPAIDAEIRRARTIAEVRGTLHALEAGVNAPAIYYVDVDDCIIFMEFIEGVLLREYIDEHGASTRVLELAREAGRQTALMHSRGLVHGDLTTSNMMVTGSGKLYIIDYGLSGHAKTEREKAIDVHLFKRSLESTHPEYLEPLYNAFLKGYAEEAGEEAARRLDHLVEEIRMMGRYVEERRRRKP
ncbi:MAG: Kae1-associated kinase Bud32 [Crenarchaeota archaeon]|nr:Kae1-associated kinase Bud32 [Thermoproteota archaeon]